jgi:ubiquinone/menaquinone biosynthesis C-methylase UbiE
MRWLESAPGRYDAGMRWITLGRSEALHAAVAEAARGAGERVLEIGCGTGAVTGRLVEAGARVTALDQDPAMLERARDRLAAAGAAPDAVAWLERTAAEVDGLPELAFDAVAISLALSEMSTSERLFVLRAARQRLAAGGVLVVADEVLPDAPARRALFTLLRLPQAALGWLLVGAVSRPVRDLAGEVRAAGFRVREERRWLLGSLALVVAEPAAAGVPA